MISFAAPGESKPLWTLHKADLRGSCLERAEESRGAPGLTEREGVRERVSALSSRSGVVIQRCRLVRLTVGDVTFEAGTEAFIG